MIKGLIVTNAYSHSKQVEYKISRFREEFLKCDVVLEVKDTIELGFPFSVVTQESCRRYN